MLPDEVREAVERLREIAHRDEAKGVTARADDLRVALAHLLAREAEVERLQDSVNSLGLESAEHFVRGREWAERCGKQEARAERAEALLRECLTAMELHPATHARITADISENSRG